MKQMTQVIENGRVYSFVLYSIYKVKGIGSMFSFPFLLKHVY